MGLRIGIRLELSWGGDEVGIRIGVGMWLGGCG